MKQAVIFGAGSVGRGFIGQLFSEAGMHVLFVDVAPDIVHGINRDYAYPHITVSAAGREVRTIGNVSACFSSDEKRVIEAISSAEIIATSVGASVLPIIAGVLARGLRTRFAHVPNLPSTTVPACRPVNILLCENLHDASHVMRRLLLAQLGNDATEWLDAQVGLLETSIGRMIPIPSEELRSIHPAAVCVEPYRFLPYDAAAVKGVLPQVPGLIGDHTVSFSFYAERKLYIHNMGHCLCAFLGALRDVEFIADAIALPEIRYFVRAAMMESAIALSIAYKASLGSLVAHIDDLLLRFDNAALKDTVARVGRDPIRKLAPGDRFFGAILLARGVNVPHVHLLFGAALGLHRVCMDENLSRLASLAVLAPESMSTEEELSGTASMALVRRGLQTVDDTDPDLLQLNCMLTAVKAGSDFTHLLRSLDFGSERNAVV